MKGGKSSETPAPVTQGLDFRAILPHLLAVGFFVYAFFICLRPLTDPDLWWHLMTGKWILMNNALPGHGNTDPFYYSLTGPLSNSGVMGLRSQWLGQVAIYLVFKAVGYSGFSIFRDYLILLPFLYLYVRFSGRGTSPLFLVPALAFPVLYISKNIFYNFERPQVFSYYLSLAVFLLLGRLKARSVGPWWVLLPALMALWSNLHGAYLVGVVIIAAYMAGEAVAIPLRRRGLVSLEPGPASPVRFFGGCALGIAATGLNPGGYMMLSSWLVRLVSIFHSTQTAGGGSTGGGSIVLAEVLEYRSLWYFYSVAHYTWPLYLFGFFLLGLAALVARQLYLGRFDVPETLVGLFMVAFGSYYARGISFTLIFSSLALCSSVVAIRRAGRAVLTFVALSLLVFMLFDVARTTPWELEPSVPEYWVDASYPEGAVRFLEENEPVGPMFNDLRWGGYLTWRLYPKYRIFIDGRMISGDVTGKYLDVVKARPGFEGILDSYGVNLMLVSMMSMENGVISPLVMKVAREGSGWRLVYLWNNAAVFVREGPENQALIECCSLPISEVYKETNSISDHLLMLVPGHPEALLSKAVSLYELGMLKEAKRILLGLPDNTDLRRELLRRLEGD